jgi:diacylglycerol kinase (ATP)
MRVGRIGVIANVRSQVHRRNPDHLSDLAGLLRTRGTVVATRSLDEVRLAAEACRRREVDLIGISGGDGTIAHTLTAVVGVYGDAPLPPIALLRGGTVNTILRGLGIRVDGREMLRRVLAGDVWIDRRHALQIGDRNGFIFGSGAVASFCEAYYETGAPSVAMSAWLLARGVASSLVGGPFSRRLVARHRARVTVDGGRWPVDDFATILAATVPQLGLGFRPFYRCGESAGHFALLGIHCSSMSLVLELPRAFAGVAMNARKVIDTLAREAMIESPRGFPYVIDGEVFHSTGSLRLATGPLLDLVIPNR